MKPRAMREARTILLVLGICWLVSLLFFQPLSVLLALFILFVLYFFRDPERTPPADASLLVAPADGKVVEVSEVDETEHFKTRVRRIGIFLSVFDVHVNRSPIAGEVLHSEEVIGEFLDARDPESSTRNARRTWVFRNDQITTIVRQISGAIARRIVPWSRVGDTVKRGQRFGMIRFGSRTEIDLPLDIEILVKVGDVVRGGETPVARISK